jgi:hypothetical protein
MLQDNEEKRKEQSEMLDLDNDGHESVSEYYQKQKSERDANKEQLSSQKKENKNEDEETAKALIQGAGTVISAVPHFASFVLGAGTGGGFKWLYDEYKKLREKENGKK